MAYQRPAAPRGTAPSSQASKAPERSRGEGGNTSTRSTPTPKMLEFARRVAEDLGIALPDTVETSFEACRDFLDANPLPPTAKQIELAERLASERHVEIPEDAMRERRKMSQWIDTVMAESK